MDDACDYPNCECKPSCEMYEPSEEERFEACPGVEDCGEAFYLLEDIGKWLSEIKVTFSERRTLERIADFQMHIDEAMRAQYPNCPTCKLTK